MSLEEQRLYTVLASAADVVAMVEDRVYPMVLQKGDPLPAVTFQRISGGQNTTLEGYGGARLQVDCWAEDYGTAKNLALRVKAALEGDIQLKAVLVNDRDGYEAKSKTYSVSQDFLTWGGEA